MELICAKCDGLGEERVATRTMSPYFNIHGWHRGPPTAAVKTRLGDAVFTFYDCAYYYRECKTCAGTGFRPSGQSVPLVPPKAPE